MKRQPNPRPDANPSVCPFCRARYATQSELVVHIVNGPHGTRWSPSPRPPRTT